MRSATLSALMSKEIDLSGPISCGVDDSTGARTHAYGADRKPGEALIDAATREAAELLVVGSDRLGTPGRRSVAEVLVAPCQIPVLLVPAPTDIAGTESEPPHGDERLPAAWRALRTVRTR